jgi:hypothetical protein
MRPGNAVGALGVLYIGRGDEVRGRGRKSGSWGTCTSSAECKTVITAVLTVMIRFSIPAILKPKRRGRGDARAPLEEGSGGGGREASGPVRRRWPEAHGGARRAAQQRRPGGGGSDVVR